MARNDSEKDPKKKSKKERLQDFIDRNVPKKGTTKIPSPTNNPLKKSATVKPGASKVPSTSKPGDKKKAGLKTSKQKSDPVRLNRSKTGAPAAKRPKK